MGWRQCGTGNRYTKLAVLVGAFIITASLPLPVLASDLAALPQRTSDQVRAARSVGSEDALVFDLSTEISSVGSAAKLRFPPSE